MATIIINKKIPVFEFTTLKKLVSFSELLSKHSNSEETSQFLVNTCVTYSEQLNSATLDASFRKATQKEIISFSEKLYKIAGELRFGQATIVYLNLSFALLMLPVLEKKIAGATLILMHVLKNKDKECDDFLKWCDRV